MLDIILKSIIALEEYNEVEHKPETKPETKPEEEEENQDMKEVEIKNIDLEQSYNISNNNDFANIYETIDKKINEDLLEHLKITLMKKKIKINIDLNELFEEDVESDTD